ncbi:MAG: hypothetical protein D8M58_19160 [Calditrichaeota bacterium]|nr:MAG: hypothetical protein DWQ03_21840 [Calditrichota bacterium]MBL1207531.1 hypothetical protein [Calditrichota bacterium]NOG47363.1 hypothetical protein [Calditrichota bacterium]
MNLNLKKFFIVFCLLTSLTLFPQNITAQTSQKYTIENSEVFFIDSKSVKDQTYKINVFIPESYAKTKKEYPVVYLLDGDLLFGMAADLQLGMRWGGHLPEVFIVGIGYRQRADNKRAVDFVPKFSENNGRGDFFLSFIKNELVPAVESKYRIESENRTLYGYSRGGLFTLYALFSSPKFFKNYIAGSYILERMKFSLIDFENSYFDNHKVLPANVYLCAGEYESPKILSFANKIKSRDYEGLNLFIEEFPKTNHYTTGNSNSFVFGLRTLINKKSIFEKIVKIYKEKGFEYSINKFNELKLTKSDNYSFKEQEINSLGYYFLERNKLEEAKQFFLINTKLYPDSWNAFDSLGEAFLKNGENKMAIENYEIALKLNPEAKYINHILKKLRAKR